MTRSPLLGLLVGALIAAGLFIVYLGAQPQLLPSVARVPGASKKPSITLNVRAFATFAVSGLAVAAMTGWWSIGLLAAVAGVLLPAMYAERKGQIADRRRVAAVASWVETVRDVLSAASGIDEAIIRSAETLPPTSPIRGEVQALASIAVMGGLRNGLRRFAENMADPTVDYVAATLVIATERSSGVLHEQLTEAAEVAREQVSVRERVDASRSRLRTASTAIVVVTVVMVVFIIGTQPSYADWYGKPTGQIVLSVAGMIELVGMWWLARIARPEPGTRITLDLSTSIGGAR
jgi:tight adherence protein B